MMPPQEFADEYWQMRERLDWLMAGGIVGGQDGKDLSKAKLFVAGLQEFYEKWQPVIQDPKLSRGLKTVRGRFEGLRVKLEKIYWAQLHEVIEARKGWASAEAIFKALVAITVLRKEMPEHLRAEFEKTIRDRETGASFDAETYYRLTEQNASVAEAKFRKELTGLAVDWPERVDAALRERLEQADMAGANQWQAEVVAQQNAVI